MCLQQEQEMTKTELGECTNYDVLLEKADGFKLCNEDHVGNKRFEILLNLHRQLYQQAKSEGDEEKMGKIVRKIIDIVCRKCIPNGRFLEHNISRDENGAACHAIDSSSEWFDLGQGILAERRVHEALGMSYEGRSSKIFSTKEQPEESVKSEKFLPAAVDMKRRRRGSYARLRRSISESMLFKPEDAEKLSNQDGTEAGKMVQTPNPMDVVFQANRKRLSNNDTTGNARFTVLVKIQSGSFASTDQESRKTICNDIICTVEHEWKGRFLVESLLGYVVLSPQEVKEAISNYVVNSLQQKGTDGYLQVQDKLEKKSPFSNSICLPVKRPSPPQESHSPPRNRPAAFHESIRYDGFDWGKFNQVDDSLNSFTVDSMEFDSSAETGTVRGNSITSSSTASRSASLLSNPPLPPTLQSDGEAKGLRNRAVDFLLKFKKKSDLNKRLGSRFAKK